MIEQKEIDKAVKSFDIESYLCSKGIIYTLSKKGFCLCSPFRTDKKPGALIYFNTKVFIDGEDVKMSPTKFVMELEQCSLPRAIEIMTKQDFESKNKTSQPIQPKKEDFKLAHTQALQNRILIQYLETERCISFDTAKHCGVEEGYKDKLFWIIFRNNQGGYAMRNGLKKPDGTPHKYAKISTSPQGITTIKHKSDTVVLFEGFINYLSAEEYWHCITGDYIPYDIIVLNSTQNRKYADLRPYKHIKCFLDNDFKKSKNTGLKCFQEIQNEYPHAVNLSEKMFPNFNDFNDYWIDYKKQLQKSL